MNIKHVIFIGVLSYIIYKLYIETIEGNEDDIQSRFGDYRGPSSGRGVINQETSEDECGPGTPCADYGDKNCRTETITGTAKSKWVYGEKGDSNKYKLDCMRCIQGSKEETTMMRYLAYIGYESNKNNNHSYYAKRVCDAMAADCDSISWYANARSDWSSQDCKDVSITDDTISMTSRLLCSIITNPVIQFFLSFLGGVTCTLKIKALELEQSITNAGKCLVCKMCGGPISCPNGCDTC